MEMMFAVAKINALDVGQQLSPRGACSRSVLALSFSSSACRLEPALESWLLIGSAGECSYQGPQRSQPI